MKTSSLESCLPYIGHVTGESLSSTKHLPKFLAQIYPNWFAFLPSVAPSSVIHISEYTNHLSINYASTVHMHKLLVLLK